MEYFMEYENVKIGIFQEKRKTYKFSKCLEYGIVPNSPKSITKEKYIFH